MKNRLRTKKSVEFKIQSSVYFSIRIYECIMMMVIIRGNVKYNNCCCVSSLRSFLYESVEERRRWNQSIILNFVWIELEVENGLIFL